MIEYKIKKKHIDKFEEYLKYYVYDFWNLSEWDISLVVSETDENTYGTCSADSEGCMAIFTISSVWRGLKPTDDNLGRIAFHEEIGRAHV